MTVIKLHDSQTFQETPDFTVVGYIPLAHPLARPLTQRWKWLDLSAPRNPRRKAKEVELS